MTSTKLFIKLDSNVVIFEDCIFYKSPLIKIKASNVLFRNLFLYNSIITNTLIEIINDDIIQEV